MSILNILLLLSILTLSPLTHALEEALGTPTTVTSSPLAVPIAQADPATLLEAALQLREAKPALFAGAQGVLIVEVVPGSQAAEKGLQPGDIVIAYAGEAMDYAGQLVEAVQAKASEARVVLRFIRGEKVEEVGLRGGKMGVELRNIRSPQAAAFWEQLKPAIQANDYEKIIQLIRDNPKLAKEVIPPDLLAKVKHINLELDNFLEECQQTQVHSDYLLAIEKCQAGLKHSQLLKDKHYTSYFLGNLGIIYNDLDQYPKALEYHQQALAIHREIGDRRQEGGQLTNIGNVYNRLGQYLKAVEYYQQASNIFREVGDKDWEGTSLANLGVIFHQLDGDPIALEYYQQALTLHREIGNQFGEGIDLFNLGGVYNKLGQYTEALEYYRQALIIFEEIGNRRGKGGVQNNIGMVYQNSGQYDQAKPYFQDGLNIFESLRSLDDLWIAQRGLASTEVHLKQPKEAIQHYEQALDTIEQLRAGLTGGIEIATSLPARTLKTDFMRNKFFVYDELINLYHDQGDDQKAFETFERKQGRVFLEDMAQSGVRRYVDLPPATSQEEEILETQVEVARKILGEAAGKGDEAVKSARDLLATAEIAQRTFQAELKGNHPHYYDLKHPQPVKLSNLQQNVLQEGELLLIYNVRKEATDLWLVGKQHFQMFSLPLTETQIIEQVTEFRKWGIDRVDTENSQALADSLKKDFTDFTQASQALYQQLFPATVRTLLMEAKPKLLYIVPTSALYELPFEALVTENTDKPHYLLQDYAISYLSSASLLKTLRDAKQRRGTAQRQPLLAFADPVYPPCSDTTTQTTSTEESLTDIQIKGYLKVMSTDCFEPLPVSGQEARAIAELLEVEEDSQPFPLQLGEDAAKSTVLQFNDKQWLDDYRYILFSTHAILPNEVSYIQQPAIVLSHQQASEDGFLTMGDVFGLSLNTDLVILSACNTGRGETIKGEGTIGLTRAFMYAGTPAVSITLWSIEARAAKKLNVAWFNRLKDGHPLADSLREAKLEMLDQEGYYRYPYAWAGVVVFGDGK
jgi:CHAT domain-containing protein/Tfp pilus assembly protein PilF